MIDIQPTHFEMVTSILAEYVGEYEVRAFGSRVKQTATTFSDLDLVIMTDEPLSLRLLTQLDNAFFRQRLALESGYCGLGYDIGRIPSHYFAAV